ncbi:MAG: TIGR04222 domain-containing membrane protein [Actinophytocola sp.]|uniref:TIGR04222 domain-containing membrane protein n=1 Tax=Actinophytocola sp. TaxID=1872138 RepID=UPI003C753360
MHPWGLSGPEFLWLYGAGLVVGVVVAIWTRMRVRRPRLAEPPGRLDVTELGFLGGGPVGAVQVAIARLAGAGLVRVNRSGQVSDNSGGGSTGHPLDDAVLYEANRPRMVAAIVRRDAVGKEVTAIGDSLVRRGLLVAPSAAIRARRLGPVVLYVVFAAGIVRWINGMAENLPVGYLTFLLALTLVLVAVLKFRAVSGRRARTVHGDRVVAEVRAQGSDAEPLARMAVTGPRVLADTNLSEALALAAPAALTPLAWNYASSGSYTTSTPSGYTCSGGSSSSCSGGSSSSCSGGSSCGGGGGCGGGSG